MGIDKSVFKMLDNPIEGTKGTRAHVCMWVCVFVFVN